jgi:hypothetical protein
MDSAAVPFGVINILTAILHAFPHLPFPIPVH